MNGLDPRTSFNARELFAFLAIYIIWGSTYLAIRQAVETIPPLLTAGVRHLVAGVVLYVISRSAKANGQPPDAESAHAPKAATPERRSIAVRGTT